MHIIKNKCTGCSNDLLAEYTIIIYWKWVVYKNYTDRKDLRKAIVGAKEVAWKKICGEADTDIWSKGYQIVMKKCSSAPNLDLEKSKILQVLKIVFPKDDEINWGEVLLEATAQQLEETPYLQKKKQVRQLIRWARERLLVY